MEVIAGRYDVVLPIAGKVVLPHDRQAVRIFVGETLNQDGVDDGENGGVGTDAESEGGDGDGGKAGRRRQQPDAMSATTEAAIVRTTSGLLGEIAQSRIWIRVRIGVRVRIGMWVWMRVDADIEPVRTAAVTNLRDR